MVVGEITFKQYIAKGRLHFKSKISKYHSIMLSIRDMILYMKRSASESNLHKKGKSFRDSQRSLAQSLFKLLAFD